MRKENKVSYLTKADVIESTDYDFFEEMAKEFSKKVTDEDIITSYERLKKMKSIAKTKKIICGILFAIGVFMILGIIGGTECGEPLSNVFWCFPIMFVMWVVARIGRLFKIGE